MMQDYCRLLGIGVRDEDLRDLGETVQALPIDHPIAGVVKRAKDFARPNALADALLNPQDRAYSVPQIYDWLERCGLKFGRWYEQAAYLPQCGAIDGAPHGARLAALPPPAQHAAIELLRGTMDRHSFVAYRDDREREAQPISFEGGAWRGFVPVRLPWTLTVKDRAPRGVAAVLINPRHTYPDLALFIDAVQERLLTAIDGERSIAEILHGAGGAIGDEAGRQFFQATLGARPDRVRRIAFEGSWRVKYCAYCHGNAGYCNRPSVLNPSNTIVDRQYSTKGDIDQNVF